MFEYDKYLPFETNKETGDRSLMKTVSEMLFL